MVSSHFDFLLMKSLSNVDDLGKKTFRGATVL